MMTKLKLFLLFLLLAWPLTACSAPTPDLIKQQSLKVVASTSIVGDVVRNIGGDAIQLDILMDVGVDPHSFEPSPKQVAAMSDADVIFIHGLGLEETMAPLLDSMAAEDKLIVSVAANVETIAFVGDSEEGDAHDGVDPHTWLDPNNVLVWVDTITTTLSDLDPAHAQTYESNAEAYRQQLRDLDTWIRKQVETIPPERRLIVTDHRIFGYFARRYGFQQIGAVVPAYSSMAGAAAQDLSALEDAIRAYHVPAIFVGNTVNPNLAERVAQDTNIRLVRIYTGSLSTMDGPAPTYIDYMRYNTTMIVEGLR